MMISTRTRSVLLEVGWSLMITLLFIAINGYTVNCGDQEEHLPYVYKLLNPALYPSDYVVPFQTSVFTVRFYFAWLLYGLRLVSPLAPVIFVLHFLSIYFAVFYLGKMAEYATGYREAFLLAPVVGFLFLNNCTVGGNSLLSVQLTGSSFAFCFGVIAFYYAMKGDLRRAGFLAGLGTLFQVLFGIHVMLLISIFIFINSQRDKLPALFRFVISYLVPALFILIPIVYRQVFIHAAGNPQQFYQILYQYRNANHYLPSAFPVADYIKTTAWWMLVFFSLNVPLQKPYNKSLKALLLVVVAGCIIYILSFLFSEFNAFGKFQWFKMTVWITMLGVIPFCNLVLSFSAIRRFLKKTRVLGGKVLVPACLLLSVLITNSASIPVERFHHRYQIGNYERTPLSKLHLWIADSTSVSTVILPLPDDDGFLCEAKRSTPVGFKAIIHEPFFMLPWYRKMVQVYGVGLLKTKGSQQVVSRAVSLYGNRPDSVIVSNVKIDFRIYDIEHTAPELLKDKQVVHREGNLVLVPFSR